MCPLYEFMCLKCECMETRLLPIEHKAQFCKECDWAMSKVIAKTGKPRLHGVGVYKPTTIRWD